MSRIITSNYIEKLNEIIDEFESSHKLNLLVDFFLEEVQKDQNRNGVKTRKIFSEDDLEKLNEIKKSKYLKRIFAYINSILNVFNGQYIHIHLNVDLSLTLEHNLISLFTWNALVDGSYNNENLENQISLLENETNLNLMMPNNNGIVKNQIYWKRYGQKHNLNFINKIKSLNTDIQKNGFLLNLNTNTGSCVNLSEFSKFPDSLNTYINFGESLQYIYELNNSILENTNTIINLFPAERGQNVWYQYFIKEIINNWNQLPGINFFKVITITSGEKTLEALLEMQKQNKFQADEIYTLFSFEL